jgi:hypothetical protein
MTRVGSHAIRAVLSVPSPWLRIPLEGNEVMIPTSAAQVGARTVTVAGVATVFSVAANVSDVGFERRSNSPPGGGVTT